MIARWRMVAARVVVGVVSVAAGCGGGGDGIGDDAAAALAGRVAEVRATAVTDPDAARLHLAALRADVETSRQAGDLTGAASARILSAADGVEAALAPPAPEPTSAPETPPPVPVPEEDEEEDRKDAKEPREDDKDDDKEDREDDD